MIFSLKKEYIKEHPKSSKLMPHLLLLVAFVCFAIGLFTYFKLSNLANMYVDQNKFISLNLKKSDLHPEQLDLVSLQLNKGLWFFLKLKLILVVLFFAVGILTLFYRSIVKKYIELILSKQ